MFDANDDFKRIIQNNTDLFTLLGVISKSQNMSFIFKKTEKIAQGLFLATNHIKDNESIKWIIREKAVDIICSSSQINSVKAINFDSLNKYEYTQEDYVKTIEPNTYSIIRGENMLELISAMIDVLLSHVHNINKPYVKDGYPQHKRLMELFEKMENDVLNKSIRIN